MLRPRVAVGAVRNMDRPLLIACVKPVSDAGKKNNTGL